MSCWDKLANFVLSKEISAMSKVTSEARSLDHVSHTGSARVRETPPYQRRNLGCAFQFCANVREKPWATFLCVGWWMIVNVNKRKRKSDNLVLHWKSFWKFLAMTQDFEVSATVIVNGQSEHEQLRRWYRLLQIKLDCARICRWYGFLLIFRNRRLVTQAKLPQNKIPLFYSQVSPQANA